MRAALVAAGLGLAVATAAQAAPATVEQPRAYGHVLGDVITQRVLLQQAGRAVTPTALPPADRSGLWLERRAPRIETDAEARRWLVIDYQLINAPRTLGLAALPALSIATEAGEPLDVAEWPLSIGPLTPPEVFARGELQALQPDRPATPHPTGAQERRLRVAAGTLGAVLLAWIAWWAWRNRRDARRLPCAHAWQQLQRLNPSDPQAWQALHHALNATAGRVVHRASLPRLLAEDAPQLRPLGAQIESFYAHSSARFFAATEPGAEPFALRALARALRDAERRHAR